MKNGSQRLNDSGIQPLYHIRYMNHGTSRFIYITVADKFP